MNEMQIFQNEQFGSIRTVVQNGEPWFVAKDVCEALEIQNVTQALDRLDDDERSMFNIGRQGEANVINEPGLYTLILGSRKPEAKAFKRWVTHEVLPAIRKTGRYAAPGTMTDALAEMHAAMKSMQTLLSDMKQTLPPINPVLGEALKARTGGYLEPRHVSGRCGGAHKLLDKYKIGHKITVYLIEENMSTEELAEELGVSANTVFRWRRGAHAPTGEPLEKICAILGCTVNDLLI